MLLHVNRFLKRIYVSSSRIHSSGSPKTLKLSSLTKSNLGINLVFILRHSIDQALIFDHYLHKEQNTFERWSERFRQPNVKRFGIREVENQIV